MTDPAQFPSAPTPTVLRLAPLLAVALLFAACGQNGGAAAAADDLDTEDAEILPLVEVHVLEKRAVQQVIETSSYIESEHRVVVLSEVMGRVVQVEVDEGERVEPAQALARLDARDAESSLKQAEIQLADARVRLDLARLERDASAHRVTQSIIERDKARTTHERNQNLSRELIAEREIDESRFALEAAEEAVLVAKFDERKAELEVRAAENSVADLEAKVGDARLVLEDHVIRSPLGGVVETLSIRGGETISVATELAVVVDTDRLVSFLARPQRELAILRDARQVEFRTDAFPERQFVGEIDLVSPVINADNGQFRVRMRVAPSDVGDLRPGMFVRARILTEDEREALMIPKAAVLNDGIESVVFVVRDGTARRMRVEPGVEEPDYLEARNVGETGLQVGDTVVISGHRELRDQAKVEVVAN